MAKSQETKNIENALCREFYRQYGCLEVSIGIGSKIKERVDFMVYDHYKDVFKCFEIKVSKADFRSSAAKSFVGHYNYYAMTPELYYEVQNEIPSDIGVYLCGSTWGLSCEKKAKRRELSEEEKMDLKDSLIRSLSRDANKLYQQEDEALLDMYKRELARAERTNKKEKESMQKLSRKCSCYENVLMDMFGREYVKKLCIENNI